MMILGYLFAFIFGGLGLFVFGALAFAPFIISGVCSMREEEWEERGTGPACE